MRTVLVLLLLTILPYAFAHPYLYITNKCADTVDLFENEDDGHGWERLTLLAPGHNFTFQIVPDSPTFWAADLHYLKNGASGKMEAQIMRNIFTDIIIIDVKKGFDIPMQIGNAQGDVVLSCTNADCFGPGKWERELTASGSDYKLVFCP